MTASEGGLLTDPNPLRWAACFEQEVLPMAHSMALSRPFRLAFFVRGAVALTAGTVLTACAANLQATPQQQAPMMVTYAPSTNGYLSLPNDGQARHPGVVLIHE